MLVHGKAITDQEGDINVGSEHRLQSGSLAVSSRSAFIPGVAAGSNLPVGTCSLDMPVTCGEDEPASLEKKARLSRSSKVSALLPNGVKLALECGDEDELRTTSELGVTFRLGADLKV